MTLRQIREQAKNLGIKNVTKYRKESLIKVIQETEGNRPCFRAIPSCGEFECAWREECQN